MFLGIKLEGWLTIIAIVLGPLLAFAVQRWRDSRRDRIERKRQIYRQLLLTLKVPMNPRHVDALNSIPLEFYQDSKVMQGWRLYTSHLNDSAMLKNANLRWGEKKFELLLDLAYEIGLTVGYTHIDKATLKDNLYVPQGYADVEEEQRQIRENVLKVLKGGQPVAMTMVGPVEVAAPLPVVEELIAARPALPLPHGEEP
jgi:hypothetical protein